MASNDQLTVEERFEIMEAKEEIRRVIDRYSHTLDRTIGSKNAEDAAEFSELSTDDIGRWVGMKELQEGTKDGLYAFGAGQHMITSVDIYELDLKRGFAKVRANLIGTHVYKPHPGVTGTDVLRDRTTMGSVYDYNFRRCQDGRWRICKNHLDMAWFQGIGEPL